MKNILIFAAVAGIAGAIAIYLATTNDNSDDGYVTDADRDYFDLTENNGPVKTASERGFHALG